MKKLSNILLVLLLLVGVGAVMSCKEKKQQDEIIVDRVIDKPRDEVKRVTKDRMTENIKWVDGHRYNYTIEYQPLDTLPPVENYGEMYCDNQITLTITRMDESVMCTKKITKNSFSGLLTSNMREHGVLLSLVYETYDIDHLYFVATIGSPDEANDDYVLLQYVLDRFGNTSVVKYTKPTM